MQVVARRGVVNSGRMSRSRWLLVSIGLLLTHGHVRFYDCILTSSRQGAITECKRVDLASPEETADLTFKPLTKPLTGSRPDELTEGSLLLAGLRFLEGSYRER
jgi:hypothetical protein